MKIAETPEQYKLGGKAVPATDASKYGGAIKDPTVVPVAPKKGLKEIIYEEERPGLDYEDDEGDEEDYVGHDEEAGAYSHYGGSLSGRGLAHDPPDVARAMIQTFAQHPEVLHTYIQGRVPNPRQHVPHLTQKVNSRQGAGASIVDYGGSMSAISHSENGYLVSHDSRFPHEFHIR